jgi:hypothetical protein
MGFLLSACIACTSITTPSCFAIAKCIYRYHTPKQYKLQKCCYGTLDTARMQQQRAYCLGKLQPGCSCSSSPAAPRQPAITACLHIQCCSLYSSQHVVVSTRSLCCDDPYSKQSHHHTHPAAATIEAVTSSHTPCCGHHQSSHIITHPLLRPPSWCCWSPSASAAPGL